jgi:hypothetical protein
MSRVNHFALRHFSWKGILTNPVSEPPQGVQNQLGDQLSEAAR